MMDLKQISKEFADCACGVPHACAIHDIAIGTRLVHHVGEILQRNRFPKNILLVADQNTLAAAEGILEALSDFKVTRKIYEALRVATMQDVHVIESYFEQGIDGVLAVGTGSIHDPCRLACANKAKPLCLFATAPSMDGFASYSAPIVDNCFKITYPAKCPEIIIGDTHILANAPAALKTAGFGDMMAKYVALIDWQVSHLLSGESYCPKVASLTRQATDKMMTMANRVTLEDEESARVIFESLLLTGIAMSFTKTSRPGSGTEHIMAHYWECLELLQNKIPNYHGTDVGVATLIILNYYNQLAELPSVHALHEQPDWNKIYAAYGKLAPDVERLNTPSPITDTIDPRLIEQNWEEIRRIVHSVPSYEECLHAMQQAGCAVTIDDIGKSKEFVEESFRYHPYMRRRVSLKGISHLIEPLTLKVNI